MKAFKENGDIPKYIVSLGKVKSKKNPSREYFGFQLVQGRN
jgi:ribosomal protein L39E